ncbi:carbohydrate kinase family protein [Myceligenerans xiligouense]|uniref:Sugar/nucleoside kinase (Ribokinase family) n=1 Tax=Myceligenerans xiligouense TaxID=253184 RepID=A0A3N4YSE0_9MICO|nr:carbohydrate kinase family protein [Myceligenerans xiligouense]RPF22304.1 sugar/nucleoside kinase (ribokinase family) [Myceligenerans xiligouense]
MSTPSTVVVGPASWNTLVRLDELPAPRPHTVFARDSVRTLGGTSAGKALHLADLGAPVALVTAVGDDPEADLVLGALGRAGEHLEILAHRAPGPTEQHLNLMTDAGERVSIYLAVTTEPARPDDEQVAARLAGARDVVLDLGASGAELLGAARAAGAELWTDLHDYDGVSEFHRPFADACSHIFLNDDGTDDYPALMRALLDRGATTVVCTLGAKGAVALTRHGWAECPAEPADVVDTNGAGDAFFAGFLAAHLMGAATGECLRAGARQAVRALGSPHLSPLLD